MHYIFVIGSNIVLEYKVLDVVADILDHRRTQIGNERVMTERYTVSAREIRSVPHVCDQIVLNDDVPARCAAGIVVLKLENDDTIVTGNTCEESVTAHRHILDS